MLEEKLSGWKIGTKGLWWERVFSCAPYFYFMCIHQSSLKLSAHFELQHGTHNHNWIWTLKKNYFSFQTTLLNVVESLHTQSLSHAWAIILYILLRNWPFDIVQDHLLTHSTTSMWEVECSLQMKYRAPNLSTPSAIPLSAPSKAKRYNLPSQKASCLTTRVRRSPYKSQFSLELKNFLFDSFHCVKS